jgi:hypothetical protein
MGLGRGDHLVDALALARLAPNDRWEARIYIDNETYY